ncbi:Hypothetical Protein FCC1311_099372 [Hondaea fermentalgiana]|uniref:Uncharacterized protein n=1 Tax=Hondaea fermentalgiana TaxID=2315210 RepID=A0A2R5H078_9STRA|nr:Hypothetical Protein FCC1311_099372 [Hondaea fermentalgiana]|eukprot:GBG33714.1 Hypothetical Protein FCC1311_099372 [Hondaea fermentalgiana]
MKGLLHCGLGGFAKVLLIAIVLVAVFSSFAREIKDAALPRRENKVSTVWILRESLNDRFEGMRASESKSSRSGDTTFMRNPATVKPTTKPSTHVKFSTVNSSSVFYRNIGDFIERKMSETFIGHKISNRTDALEDPLNILVLMFEVMAGFEDPLDAIVEFANWIFQIAQAWDDNLAVTDEARHALDRWLPSKLDGILTFANRDAWPVVKYNAELGKFFFFSEPKAKRDPAPMSGFAEVTEIVNPNKSIRSSNLTFVEDMFASFVRTHDISGPEAEDLLRLAKKRNLSLESWQHLLVVTLGVTDGQAPLAKFAQSWRRVKASDVQAFKAQSIEDQLETLVSLFEILDQLALACEELPYFHILFRVALYLFLISTY